MPWTCLATGTMLASGEWGPPIIVALIAGIGGAVLSACITAHLALKKHQAGQWWDEKFRTYRELMTAITDTAAYYKHEAVKGHAGDVPLADEKACKEALDKLKTYVMALGPLLLSKEAQLTIGDHVIAAGNTHDAAFPLMMKRTTSQEEEIARRKAIADALDAIASTCVDLSVALPAIARRDLGVRPGSGSRLRRLCRKLRWKNKDHNADGKD